MGKTYRMILVDDEPWALLGLEEIIDWNEEGFEIVARCNSGEEALECAVALHPDVVVTDIRMPGISGLSLIKALKERQPSVQCVIVSAYSDFTAAREAIRLSAAYYIIKPFQEEEVREAARILLERLRDDQREIIEIDEGNPTFPPLPVQGRRCWLILTDRPGGMKLMQDFMKRTNEKESDGEICCMQIVRIGKRDGILTDKLPDDVPPDVGISVEMPDFSEAGYMTQTAYASLEGGFRFAPVTPIGKSQLNTADIQLWLYEHLEEEITLKTLVNQFYLNETYLCDLFKKQVGETIFAFLRRIRMNRAVRLMEDSRLTLQEIAERCGYKDYSHFGQHFKREVGVAPNLYRRQKYFNERE